MKTIIIILLAIILPVQTNSQTNASLNNRTILNSINTNENYIRNLNSNMDFENTINVFDFVFSNLEKDIKVYPTENYYYFQFDCSGKTFKGNIALFANERDDGRMNFSYEEVYNLADESNTIKDGHLMLDNSQGVLIKKINEFEYTVTFKEKMVTFHLNQLDTKCPKSLKLSDNEVYVGPAVDESGVKFHLIFNNNFKNLFWVLDEEYQTPESFVNLIDNVIIGKRTQFVFYHEKDLSRKILYGVNSDNVNKNTWFDGPFDQLPDNYIKTDQINLQTFIEEAYPFYKGKIDKYGHFLKEEGMRVAISPYLVYKSYAELLKVYYASKNSSHSNDEFIFNLTQERYFDKDEIK